MIDSTTNVIALLRNLYDSKNMKNTHGRVILLLKFWLNFIPPKNPENQRFSGVFMVYKMEHAALLKVTLVHGCFSRFLNCTNGTKSRKASYLLQWLRTL